MSNFSDWKSDFEKKANKINAGQVNAFNDTVKQVYSKIVDRTPVGDPSLWKYPAHKDYIPGTLKASWTLDMEQPGLAIIQNLTPYAYRVEYGWSTQAPTGMVRLTLKEFDDILQANGIKYKNGF